MLMTRIPVKQMIHVPLFSGNAFSGVQIQRRNFSNSEAEDDEVNKQI
jgi:hypothetical protein